MSAPAFPKPTRARKPRRPLRRKRWPRRHAPKRPPGWDDPAYRADVRQLPCCCPAACHPGPVQAHHAGDHAGIQGGVGLKPPDSTCIPLTAQHHEDLHRGEGAFEGWPKAQRRAWSDARIPETQAEVARLRAGRELG